MCVCFRRPDNAAVRNAYTSICSKLTCAVFLTATALCEHAQLREAVRYGEAADVVRLIKSGANPKIKDGLVRSQFQHQYQCQIIVTLTR